MYSYTQQTSSTTPIKSECVIVENMILTVEVTGLRWMGHCCKQWICFIWSYKFLTNCQRRLQQSHLAHQNHQWRADQTLRQTPHREGWTVLLLTLWVGVSLSRRCERRCENFSNGMLVTQGTPFAERKGVVSSPDRQGRRARAQKKNWCLGTSRKGVAMSLDTRYPNLVSCQT